MTRTWYPKFLFSDVKQSIVHFDLDGFSQTRMTFDYSFLDTQNCSQFLTNSYTLPNAGTALEYIIATYFSTRSSNNLRSMSTVDSHCQGWRFPQRLLHRPKSASIEVINRFSSSSDARDVRGNISYDMQNVKP